jgi:hypothetical protein
MDIWWKILCKYFASNLNSCLNAAYIFYGSLTLPWSHALRGPRSYQLLHFGSRHRPAYQRSTRISVLLEPPLPLKLIMFVKVLCTYKNECIFSFRPCIYILEFTRLDRCRFVLTLTPRCLKPAGRLIVCLRLTIGGEPTFAVLLNPPIM